MKSKKIQILVITVFVLIAYSNIFRNEFVIDDKSIFVEWDLIRSPANIPKFFKSEGIFEGNPPVGYRPVRTSLMAVSYRLWSERWGYHLQAIFLHLVCTLLVYLIVREIFLPHLSFPRPLRSRFSEAGRRESINSSGSSIPSASLRASRSRMTNAEIASSSFAAFRIPCNDTLRYLPFLTALLFGLHPIHTEVVSFISASFDMFGFIFFLGSVAAYLYANAIRMKMRIYANIVSVVLAGLAYFTYEATLCLPLVLILYDFCFKNRKSFSRYLPYIALGAFYFFVRLAFVHVTSRGLAYFEIGPFLVLLTPFLAFARYLYLLFVPLNLSLDPHVWGMLYAHTDSFLIAEKFGRSGAGTFVSVLLVGAIIFLAIKFWHKQPIVSFAIGWIFITFLPISSPVLTGVIMQERYAYLMSVGWCMLAGWVVCQCYANVKRMYGNVLILFVVIVLMGYGIRTFERNRDWRNDIVLNKSTAESSPYNWGEYNHLGVKYSNIGQYELGVKAFTSAIEIKPDFWLAHYNLANAYLILGRKEEASAEYKKTLDLNPSYLPAENSWKNLSIVKSGSILAHFQSKISNLLFDFPAYWSVEEDEHGIILKDSKSDFIIEIRRRLKPSNLSFEKYVQEAADTYGRLTNQGPAQIPNFNQAYVRKWNDNGVEKMEFFLFGGERIVHVLAYPENSASRNQFDSILGSVKVK